MKNPSQQASLYFPRKQIIKDKIKITLPFHLCLNEITKIFKQTDISEKSKYSLMYFTLFATLASSPCPVWLENKKNTRKWQENIKPWSEEKIQSKKRSLRKEAFDIPMEFLADALQFNKLTSVYPTDNFQKDIIAQNQEEFHAVLFHFSLLESPQN